MVVLTGIVSCGALVHGLINYIQIYLSISLYILIPIIVVILGGITILGITESVVTIFIMTLLEILGLIIIIWYGRNNLIIGIKNINQLVPSFDIVTWQNILSGAFIAFYAFIGFEDMVNLAEETKNPEKTMPMAIFFAAIFASLLYIIIAFVTVNSFDKDTLENIKSPLTAIIARQGHSSLLFDIIAMISITNGILVNIIMASRLIFGMTKLKTSPRLFAKIYEKTQIPLFATVFVMMMTVILAYWFPIQTLAKITSTITLVIFCLMHLSLIIIKKKVCATTTNHIVLPFIIPIIGFFLCLIFLIVSIYSEL